MAAAFVVSPLNIVAAICAAKALHPSGPPPMHVVVQSWPGLLPQVGREIADIVALLASPFDFIAGVHLVDAGGGSEEEFAKARIALQELPGAPRFSEIYFPHDVGLRVLDELLALHPQALQICTGDALGFLVDRELHLGLLRPQQQPTLRGRLRAWLGFGEQPAARKIADQAIAVLPVDQSGRFLQGVPLLVPPKTLVEDVVARCREACSALRAHERDLLALAGDRPIGLMITENHAEAGLIEFEREIDLYCWAIREHCVPGSVVFIKPHPGEQLPRTAAIAAGLPGFNVVPVDARYARYPVELLKELVARSRSICMSYPALSLRYLYGADMVQPMDAAVIRRWFPQRVWESYKNAIETYDAPAQLLAQWDGISVLWSGRFGAKQLTF